MTEVVASLFELRKKIVFLRWMFLFGVLQNKIHLEKLTSTLYVRQMVTFVIGRLLVPFQLYIVCIYQ